jgi:beta-glucoside operon transcriptional antiterminator
MLIKQILNNNVVSAADMDGNELILTGRGLGFKVRPGDEVDNSIAEKIFIVKDEKINYRFKTLLIELPLEVIQLTDDIVNLAQKRLGNKLSEAVYTSLADHIHFAIQRHNEGIGIKNPLQWEVKNFYQSEYQIGHQALAIIAARTGVLLSDTEACSIALHLVNAGINSPSGQLVKLTTIIHQIQSIVKYWFSISINEEDPNFQRFIVHTKFFAQRILNGKVIDNDDNDLYQALQLRYKKTLSCVSAISDFIRKNYQHEMSDSERLYLAIHINNMIQRQKTSI